MKAPGLNNNPRQVARINYCQRRAHTGGTQEDQTEPGKTSGGTDFLTGILRCMDIMIWVNLSYKIEEKTFPHTVFVRRGELS